MARGNILIPITDHDDNCSLYYLVEYKAQGETAWTSFETNITTIENYLTIENVADGIIYDIRVTRYCCNGATSQVLTLTKDTTTPSTQLATPANYTLTPNANAGELDADCDDVASATEYIFEVAKDIDFTIDKETATNATSDYTFTGLDTGVTYYGRAKARANGFLDSDWSNTDTGIPV